MFTDYKSNISQTFNMLLNVILWCIFSVSFLTRSHYELVLLALWVIKSPSGISFKYYSSSKKCTCSICMVNILCARHHTPVIERVLINESNEYYISRRQALSDLYSDPISSFMVGTQREDTDGLYERCMYLHFILVSHCQVVFSACNASSLWIMGV